MAKPGSRPRRAALAAPPAPKPDGEPLPLSHAAAFALRDVAAHHGVTEREAAEYAIGLWHWLSGHLVPGKKLWLADEDGSNPQPIDLPAVKK